MRAIADDAEILSRLTSIHKLTVPLVTPITATVTTAGEEDDEELAFAKAGFAANNFILVDAGLNQRPYIIDSIPADSSPIPLQFPLWRGHAVGVRVAKLADIHLGYIETGGMSPTGSSSGGSISAANANGPVWNADEEQGEMAVSWGQVASSLENILSSYGIDESHVRGDGTPGNPYRAEVHPDLALTQKDYCYLAKGRYKNNKILNVVFLGCTPTISGNPTIGNKTTPAVWTVGCKYTHKVFWID